jgi:hypothetical protein
MKKLLFLTLAFMICACGSVAPTPKWKDNAYEQLDLYKTGFLTGREESTEPHFVKAVREMAAGNDLNLLAVAWLTKYALHAASLESFDDNEFQKLSRLEPNAADLAYCNFLKGNFSAGDIHRLPARYAGVMKAAAVKDAASAVREMAVIADPLSRLVACGVWVKYRTYDENILQTAIDTAAAHGWRRPLWAYLSKLHDFYSERGDKLKADAIKERLEFLKKQ